MEQEELPTCPQPKPTVPPPGYTQNAKCYCDEKTKEWYWVEQAELE